MSAPKFTVEVRKTALLVVGESKKWVAAVARGLEDMPLEIFTDERRVGDEYDLDYCVVLGGELPRLASGAPRLLYVQALDKKGEMPPLPPSGGALLYPEVIGTDCVYTPTLDRIVEQAAGTTSIKLHGDGLDPYHLVTQIDLIECLRELLFARENRRETVLKSASPISMLSLAYQVRSSVPFKVDILFGEGGIAPGVVDGENEWEVEGVGLDLVPPRVQAILKDHKGRPIPKARPVVGSPDPETTGVSNRLHTLKELSQSPEFVPIPVERPRRQLKVNWSPPRLPTSPLATGIFLGLSLYLASLAFVITITGLTARSLAESIGSLTLPSRSLLRLADTTSRYLEINMIALTAIPQIGESQTVQEANTILSGYRQGVQILSVAQDLSEASRAVAEYVLNGAELDVAAELKAANLAVADLYNHLSLLDADLPDIPPNLLPKQYHGNYQELKVALESGRRATLTAKALLGTSADLLGLGGRRKYLVLLQNNMELRATGGFIGSFAILSLENGHLYDMPIYDVYQADGQLKGHVEPPAEIKQYLGEANWYMRDSNWDPDFPTSARRAEWFLKKTIGDDVQGTIGINVATLATVLDAIGGVDVADYQETVTGSNIFERAEYHSEVNFFPGSTGKKEFLGAVAAALFAKLGQVSGESAIALVSALVKTVDEKNTIISLFSDKSSQTLAALGWDGAIRDLPCPAIEAASSCFADYAMLVESNFGVNKANYFINRRIHLGVTVDADLNMSHKMTISYENTATSGSWPAGPYKNYARLYLPVGAVIESVYMGGKQLGPEELTIITEHGKTVAGFLVEVPINSSLEVAVEYRLSGTLTGSAPVYSLYWQKQPGTSDDPLTVSLNHPLYLRADIVSPRAELGVQQLNFALANSTDRRITVKFQQ